MGRKSVGIVVTVLTAMYLFSVDAAAQSGNFDPEYDDATAAGAQTPAAEDEPIGGALDGTAKASTETGRGAGLKGTATGAAAAAPESTDLEKRAKRKPWEMNGIRHHSTLYGSSGLFYLPEAGSDEAGTFALGVHGTYFRYHDYLYVGDEASAMWGAMTLRVTPFRFLELYGSLASSAMSNSLGKPKLFQAFGDLKIGLKGYYTFADFITVGADVGVFFYNPVGDVGATFDGTSVAIDGLATFDLGALREFLPGRLHLGVGYIFDNSANIIEGIEKSGGGCGTDRDGDGYVEYKGCLSPDERTALGIDRNDQVRIRAGLDVLLPYVSPIFEYKLEIPVNRQDFICPKDTPGSLDQCMAERGAAGFRQVITIGARVLPPMESLALDIGVDIGLSGYGPTVHEMAAEAPWRLVFGASYSFDPFPEKAEPPPPPVVPEAPPPPPPPPTIAGFVHDSRDPALAVNGAVIFYSGREDLNPQVTKLDGRFVSYSLTKGQATVFVKADGYEDSTFSVEVPDTGQVSLDCPLKAKPKVA
ncbi:MAG: hypothetical protein MUC50_05300, partial [Myxococcota bacterium]|nr:hypothetical protein [Myxococcota bacterium]